MECGTLPLIVIPHEVRDLQCAVRMRIVWHMTAEPLLELQTL